MKTHILATATVCLLGTTVLFLAPSSEAQQSTTNRPARDNTAQQPARTSGVEIGVLDEHTSGSTIRASQLMGMNIENSQGEGVGEVNDLVIDGNSGQVRYVAVTYGGFLGVGDKLFAVPFEAFKVRQQAGDADDYVLTLNVTQQQLEGAQGFDQESWPNFADRNFTQELDRRYGIDRRAQQQDRPRVAERVDETDVDVDVDGER
jgi:sporulation protein YlmC with PRC-barrel domain